jgi:hypothetical protein
MATYCAEAIVKENVMATSSSHGIEYTKGPIDWRQRSAKLAVKHFPLHIRFDQLGLNHSTLKDQLEAMTQQHPTEKV